MFPSTEPFSPKKVAIIMALLMQAEKDKLVQSIAKNWVNNSGWGPYNQEGIISDLMAVLRVKGAVPLVLDYKRWRKSSSRSSSAFAIEIEAKAVYGTFQILLEVGKDSIVPISSYSKSIIPKLLNLAAQVDKTDQEKTRTAGFLLLETLFPLEKGKPQVKRLGQAYAATLTLNKLAGKGEIDGEAWDIYAPIICKYLNDNYFTEFGMIDTVKGVKNRSIIDSSSESSGSSESGDEVVQSKSKRIKPTKFIGIPVKPASGTSNHSKATSSNSTKPPSMVSNATTTLFNGSKMGSLLILSGSLLLLALLGCALHLLIGKQRELSEY